MESTTASTSSPRVPTRRRRVRVRRSKSIDEPSQETCTATKAEAVRTTTLSTPEDLFLLTLLLITAVIAARLLLLPVTELD